MFRTSARMATLLLCLCAAKPALAQEPDGLAWGIGTGQALSWATFGYLVYGDVSDSWTDLTLVGGLAAASLAGAGVGAAAHINGWPAWVGRGINGFAAGSGEVLFIAAMSQDGGDDVWGRVTPTAWAAALGAGAAFSAASALWIDDYRETLLVNGCQFGGLMLGAVVGATARLVRSASCSGSECPTQAEETASFFYMMFGGMVAGHVAGMILSAIHEPDPAQDQAQAVPQPSAWQLLPLSPSADGFGFTLSGIW